MSGTPTTVAAAADYTVTATNGSGMTTVALHLAVADAEPPTIAAPAGGFFPLIVFAGTLPDYRSQPVKSDNVAVTSVTQVPMEGSPTVAGDVPVTLTAHDAAGNTASTSFTVAVRPTAAVNTVLLAKDAPAPGAGTTDVPADALLASFGVPAIDDAGNVAFTAKWTSIGPPTSKGSGLFTKLTCLATVGGSVPGVPGRTFKSFADPVIHDGNLACLAKLEGTKEGSSVVLAGPATGPLAVLTSIGIPAPGAGGATFKSIKAVSVAGDYVGFLARLAPGTGTTPKTTAVNDLGLWVKDGANPFVLVLREGQMIGGKTIKTLVSFAAGNGSPGQGRGWLVERPALGALAMALVTFKEDKSQAVVQVDPDDVLNPVVLSQSGPSGIGQPSIADATFARYSLPAANTGGYSAFLATLTLNPALEITKASARGIFTADAPGSLYFPLVHTGDPTGFDDGSTFSLLKDPVLAADGGLAFPATLGGAKGLARTALWWKPPGTTTGGPANNGLLLLARGGADEVPGLPIDAQWRNFPSLAIAANRGPIFAATLVPGKGLVTKATASGVWACDFTGALRLLFQAGVTKIAIDADPTHDKTVKSFTLLNATKGSMGVTRSFNDAAQVVWLATFTDKTQAIIRTEVP